MQVISDIQAGRDIIITVGSITISARRPEIRPFQVKRTPNLYFTGREDALAALENQLKDRTRLAITSVQGMGGIGKTELALQYAISANKQGKYPGGICWLDVRGKNVADEILDFASSYLNFIPPDDQTLSKKVEVCWNLWSLAFPKDKLIVLDDVAAYDQIKDFLPPYDANLKVIITTRLRMDRLNIPSLSLEVLEDQDALELLTAYIGKKRIESALEDAQALCRWVGNLPLGLTLLGRYLREFEEDSMAELLVQLEETGIDQAAMHEPEIPIGNGKTTADLWEGERRIYESLYAVFNLNWQYLQSPGKQLGAILSLFDAPAYTWSLVEKVSQPLGRRRGVAKISLKDLHLIHEDEGNPIHSLIQEFFLKKLKEDENSLDIWNILFDNFVFQQYIYDTGYLDNGLKRIEKIQQSLPDDEIKGKILLGKMVGHSYYADRQAGTQLAVENFLSASNFSQAPDYGDTGIWYQLFSLDHAHNLVVPKGSIEISGQHYSAEDIELMLNELLPNDLKQLEMPPSARIAPYILRAAHYWGHRGNQCAFLLFRDIQNLSSERFEQLYEQGIQHYARAAVFRLLNFRLSNRRDYENHLQSRLHNAPFIPPWLSNWNSDDFQEHDIRFEQFTSAAQAVGDTAHQYRGIADIWLWGYLYLVKDQQVSKGFLREAEQLVKVTEGLWEAAQSLLKPNEKIIKYYLWMADLETKFELVQDHCLGAPLISWQEAQERLVADLDELEDKYQLSYAWARKVAMDQLCKFYQVLEKLYA